MKNFRDEFSLEAFGEPFLRRLDLTRTVLTVAGLPDGENAWLEFIDLAILLFCFYGGQAVLVWWSRRACKVERF